MARALAVAVAVSLLAVSGAGGGNAQTPRRGGTLVFAFVPPEPSCLNVVVPRCAPGAALASMENVIGRVLERPFDVDLDFNWRPRLVSHVDFTRKQPFTLTYHIRPEARWSDGVPITARNFVFTLEAIRAHGSETSRVAHEVVRTARAVGPKTLRVVLRSRYANWRTLFGNVLPSHALRGADLTTVWSDRIDDPRTGRPIASGPFLVERWERGKQLTLARNPNYWRGRSSLLDRLVVRFGLDGKALVDSFRRGELQVALGFPPELAPELRRLPGLRTVSAPGTGWEHLAIRVGPGGHPALRDKRVRRALAYAVNRAALARASFRDIDPNLPPSDSAIHLSQNRYYRANWSGYRHRTADARRLLEQTGCRRGADGIYACAGERLSLRIVSPVAPAFRPRVVELIQSQLRQAGVEVVPSFAPPTVLFGPGGILERGEFDLAFFSWFSVGPDVRRASIYGCGREQNYTGYCQRLVTRDLNQAERILDANQQARVLNRADRQMAKDVPVIPLFQQPVWAAVTTAVRGFAPSSPVNGLVNAENWWLERS